MAVFTLPNGSTISISTGFDTPKTVSAITNANPGVATSTAHGYACLLYTSPSPRD